MKNAEAKDQREFFEALISNMDKDVRELNAQILLHCVNKCFEVGAKEQIDEIMNIIFSFIPDDL